MTRRNEQIQKILAELDHVRNRQWNFKEEILQAINNPSFPINAFPINVSLEHKPIPRPHLIIPTLNRGYLDGRHDVFRLPAQQINEWENLIPLQLIIPDGNDYTYDLILNYQWSDQE